MTARDIRRTLQSEFVRTLRKPFVDAVKAVSYTHLPVSCKKPTATRGLFFGFVCAGVNQTAA